jgi:hypothetical protein
LAATYVLVSGKNSQADRKHVKNLEESSGCHTSRPQYIVGSDLHKNLKISTVPSRSLLPKPIKSTIVIEVGSLTFLDLYLSHSSTPSSALELYEYESNHNHWYIVRFPFSCLHSSLQAVWLQLGRTLAAVFVHLFGSDCGILRGRTPLAAGERCAPPGGCPGVPSCRLGGLSAAQGAVGRPSVTT